MKAMQCELCGCADIVKDGDFFVCQGCGTKYTPENAKKMTVEGIVDVSGSTVKVDTSEELANLYQIARRAKDDNSGELAAKYYEMVLMKDPTSWEASFYAVYFNANSCKIAEIQSAAISVSSCIDTVLKLIRDNVPGQDEQIAAYTEVANRVIAISIELVQAAAIHTNANNEIESYARKRAAIQCLYTLGDNLDLLFGTDTEANQLSVSAWQKGVKLHKALMFMVVDKDEKALMNSYVSRIQNYDSTYAAPKGGCYVATAVYGSYDCPQVWTLRRYRDFELAQSFWGRAFIKTYYAISPTLVKWFGQTDWFKHMWRSKLDRMVGDLQARGFSDKPYQDRSW